jgi:hypothetical protein
VSAQPLLQASARFTVDQLNVSLLFGGLVLLVAVLAVRLSDRSGLPTLLLYLGLGRHSPDPRWRAKALRITQFQGARATRAAWRPLPAGGSSVGHKRQRVAE